MILLGLLLIAPLLSWSLLASTSTIFLSLVPFVIVRINKIWVKRRSHANDAASNRGNVPKGITPGWTIYFGLLGCLCWVFGLGALFHGVNCLSPGSSCCSYSFLGTDEAEPVHICFRALVLEEVAGSLSIGSL
jgi:hypothetical protein